jgi:hypothetical protein
MHDLHYETMKLYDCMQPCQCIVCCITTSCRTLRRHPTLAIDYQNIYVDNVLACLFARSGFGKFYLMSDATTDGMICT